jgi:hypothetical protein
MERTFYLYPTLRVAPGVTYSPSAPHFEGECPYLGGWERVKGGTWKKLTP